MNDNYDDKIKKMREYLEEKQKTKDTINKDNPIYRMDEILSEKKKVRFDDGFEKTLVDMKPVSSRTEKNNNLSDEVTQKRSTTTKYEPYKKDNLLFTITLIFFLLFGFFFIISTHSLLLIKKPFNIISLVLSIVSFILLVISIILKITHRDLSKSNSKFNVKLTITIIIVAILNVALIIALNLLHFWKFLDIVIENKKIFVIIIGIIILVLFIIFMLRLFMNKKFKTNTRKLLLYLFLTYYASFIIGMIFTLYGPLPEFKEWLITTAMPTMNHQKYCKWFYSEKEIEKIMSQNFIVESGDSTDASLIKKKTTVHYKNEYERQILEHEEGEKYKIVQLEVAGMPAYLAAIYDPTSIIVEVTSSLGRMGEYVTKMAERNNALLAINGGGFMDPGGSSWGGTPTGVTISRGKLITNNEYGNATTSGGIIGFNKEGTLMLLKNNNGNTALNNGIINAVSWGPFLIVNGVSSEIRGNGGWGLGARTAIGQRSDGVVLFLVVDSNASRTRGATMGDLTEIMERYGAVNAANLDGGTSSVMALPKEIAKSKFNATCHDYFTNKYCAINDPIDSTGTHQTRYIATSFVVLDK